MLYLTNLLWARYLSLVHKEHYYYVWFELILPARFVLLLCFVWVCVFCDVKYFVTYWTHFRIYTNTMKSHTFCCTLSTNLLLQDYYLKFHRQIVESVVSKFSKRQEMEKFSLCSGILMLLDYRIIKEDEKIIFVCLLRINWKTDSFIYKTRYWNATLMPEQQWLYLFPEKNVNPHCIL